MKNFFKKRILSNSEEGYKHKLKENKAEENLKNSLALLDTILHTTDNGVLVVNTKGKIVKINNRFAEIWNIPNKIIEEADDEELLNFALSQLTDPHSFLEKVKYLYSHLAEESTDILIFKDGRIFERISKPMIIEDEPAGRVWNFIDISERKKAEELLQNERTLFRTIIDIIPDAIYVKDVEGKKILANPKEVQFAGMVSEQEYLGKTDRTIYSNEVANHSEEEDRYIMETGKPILNIESVLVDKKGEEHSLIGSKVPLRDTTGKVKGIVGINHEVTEQRRVNELLKQSEERHRALVENVGEGMLLLIQMKYLSLQTLQPKQFLALPKENWLAVTLKNLLPRTNCSPSKPKLKHVLKVNEIAMILR